MGCFQCAVLLMLARNAHVTHDNAHQLKCDFGPEVKLKWRRAIVLKKVKVIQKTNSENCFPIYTAGNLIMLQHLNSSAL